MFEEAGLGTGKLDVARRHVAELVRIHRQGPVNRRLVRHPKNNASKLQRACWLSAQDFTRCCEACIWREYLDLLFDLRQRSSSGGMVT